MTIKEFLMGPTVTILAIVIAFYMGAVIHCLVNNVDTKQKTFTIITNKNATIITIPHDNIIVGHK